MKTTLAARPVVRVLFATTAIASAAYALSGCMGADTAGSLNTPDAGVGANDALRGRQCITDEDCVSHNHVCLPGTGAVGQCGAPTNRGECTPPDPSTALPGHAPGCYPGARCQAVPATRSGTGGLCSFGAPAAQLFSLGSTLFPKISVTGPNALSVIRPTDGVRVQWTPPALGPDATLVAMLLRNVPRRVDGANRVANPRDIVWIWSSTDPGASTTPGNVPLEAGHRGLGADGELGERYGSSRLPAGRYWWFVYAQRNGSVITASDVLSFRVGEDNTAVRCNVVDDCVRQIPGELSDTVSCVSNVCRRRCASALDCPGVDGRCEFGTTLEPTNGVRPPRGGFCALPTAPTP